MKKDNTAGRLSLLIIDDDDQIRNLVADLSAESGWRCAAAEDGRRGIEMVQVEPERYDVVLLDLKMPGPSGLEVLPELLKYGRDLSVIMMTGYAEVDTAVETMKRGAADLLQKPVDPELLVARVEKARENRRVQREYREYVEDADAKIRQRRTLLDEARRLTVFGLARLAEYRDEETGYHLERIAEYVTVLADGLRGKGLYRDIITDGWIDLLYESAPLHDIGKVGVPDSILLKPEKLTVEEFEIMKKHTTIGARTLQDVQSEVEDERFLEMGIALARSHHENFDGTGYPEGLAGADIPLQARLLTMADFYDALVFPRVYRPYAFPHDEVAAMVNEQRGLKFDPDLVDCFNDCRDEFDSVRRRFGE